MLALFLTAGCEESFSPIASSDLRLSVFGYLNASADTQWVRVTPIRPAVPSGPSPTPAHVTLEHLETGAVVELRDSLFHFDIGGEVGSEGLYLHNYWTTEPIVPGGSYRLTAAATDGSDPVHAVALVPEEYEVEVWLAQPWTNEGDFLRTEGLAHLGLLTLTTRFNDDCGAAAERGFVELGETGTGAQSVPISKRFIARASCGRAEVEWRELFIVGSGSEWPEGAELDPGNLSAPDGPSNVIGGIGFLGGVLTRSVPYETCSIERLPDSGNHCILRYDDDSPGFSGQVIDVACEGGPVVGAVVELRELTSVPGGRKLRSTSSNPRGEFRIEGLDPSQRYALSVRRFVLTDQFDQFREFRDTLTFTAGEHRRYEVPLERYECEG